MSRKRQDMQHVDWVRPNFVPKVRYGAMQVQHFV
jgi:hypothetical protein